MEEKRPDEMEMAEEEIKEREKKEKGQVEPFLEKKPREKSKTEKNEEENLGKENSENNPVKKGRYIHFKGNLVEVIGTARHTETLEEFVAYIHLGESEYGKDALWVRPKKMFLENVKKDGKDMPRFKFVKQ